MSFKIHLIIVSCIIVVVYLAWQVTSRAPTPEVHATTESPYSISITHASWGLNCRFRTSTGNDTENAFSHETGAPASKLREDNVLIEASKYCNGKVKCDIPIGAKELGGDPAPECDDKLLEVEYRCFSYDRPWMARGSRGRVTIDCDKSGN